MSCGYKKGDILVVPVGKRKTRKVVFVQHDPESRSEVHIAYPGTHHVSRVPVRWLKRPE